MLTDLPTCFDDKVTAIMRSRKDDASLCPLSRILEKFTQIGYDLPDGMELATEWLQRMFASVDCCYCCAWVTGYVCLLISMQDKVCFRFAPTDSYKSRLRCQQKCALLCLEVSRCFCIGFSYVQFIVAQMCS